MSSTFRLQPTTLDGWPIFMNAPTDIYTSAWLRSKAEQIVKDSLKELSGDARREFASMALSDAERNGCDDLAYLDYLYECSM